MGKKKDSSTRPPKRRKERGAKKKVTAPQSNEEAYSNPEVSESTRNGDPNPSSGGSNKRGASRPEDEGGANEPGDSNSLRRGTGGGVASDPVFGRVNEGPSNPGSSDAIGNKARKKDAESRKRRSTSSTSSRRKKRKIRERVPLPLLGNRLAMEPFESTRSPQSNGGGVSGGQAHSPGTPPDGSPRKSISSSSPPRFKKVRSTASNLGSTVTPGLQDPDRNRSTPASFPTTTSHAEQCCNHESELTALREACNNFKSELARERDHTRAYQILSTERGETIEKLKQENQALKVESSYWKGQISSATKGTEGSKAKPRRKTIKIKKNAKTMPLLMALREQGKSWCFARVYSMSDGPKIAERKRIWDHDMVFFPDEELSHVGDTVSGGAERSRDRQRLLCGTPIIETEDGRDAVPKCPMAVAKRGGFFSTDVSERTLLWHFKVLYDTDGELRENYKSRQEFLGVAKEVSRTGIRIYKNQMHSTLSGRKKEAVDGILKYFGYPVLTHINKRSEKYEEERDKAEKFLADHLGKLTKKRSVTVARAHDEDSWTVSEPDIVLQERPVFDTYRVSEFDAIAAFNSGVEEPEAPVESEDNAFKADILFKNNAAKHVYLNWVGEGVHETTSVMELARLDAYLYAWMEVIQELIEKGEVRKVGGLRNKRFTDRFNKYLPLAVEDILKVCRDTLKEVRLEELSKPYDYEKREQAIALRGRDDEGYISLRDSTNIVSEQEHRGDIFNRHGRRHTSAFVNPVNKLDYVAITPRFFKSHICCWIGDVLDCYVGRCTSAEVKYEPITYDDECKISVEAESDSDSDREFVETSDDYFD